MGSKCCKSNPSKAETDLTKKVVDRSCPEGHNKVEALPKLTDE
jgi:hypothetical protein